MTADIAEREAFERLIISAKMLLQNAVGCVIDHYGEDYATHGEPGWIADCRADIARAAALIQARAAWTPTHRHVKRGTDYRVIGEAEAQVSSAPFVDAMGAYSQLREGDRFMVYEGRDGKLWLRRVSEFNDGRFEALSQPAPEPVAGGKVVGLAPTSIVIRRAREMADGIDKHGTCGEMTAPYAAILLREIARRLEICAPASPDDELEALRERHLGLLSDMAADALARGDVGGADELREALQAIRALPLREG